MVVVLVTENVVLKLAALMVVVFMVMFVINPTVVLMYASGSYDNGFGAGNGDCVKVKGFFHDDKKATPSLSHFFVTAVCRMLMRNDDVQ